MPKVARVRPGGAAIIIRLPTPQRSTAQRRRNFRTPPNPLGVARLAQFAQAFVKGVYGKSNLAYDLASAAP